MPTSSISSTPIRSSIPPALRYGARHPTPPERGGPPPLWRGEMGPAHAAGRKRRAPPGPVAGGETRPPAAPALQRERRQYRAARAVSRGARWIRGDHLRRARCGRLAVALAAVPSLGFGTAGRAALRAVGARTGGRARPVGGRCVGAAICVPAGQAVSAARARSHLARPPDGASEAHRPAPDGNATALQRLPVYGAHRRRHLRRGRARVARARAQLSAPCPLVERLRLLTAAARPPWLGGPALGALALAARGVPGRTPPSPRA